MYRLSGTDIVSDYETAGSIESLLTEERVWMITPTAQAVTSLYKTEEGWSSFGVGILRGGRSHPEPD